ncbi:MAG TPA: hypothetical protein VGM17_08385 [Rhizomicrobium sp.]|jgi:hypothetical protein
MKKILGVAAAALLLSAGVASAKPTDVTISVSGVSCTFSINKLGDSGNDIGKVLLTANDPNTCQFVGAGDIGKVKGLGPIATIVGTSSLLGNSDKILTLLDYPFVTGGQYRVYYTSDGKTLTFIGSGSYTVK